MTVDALAAVAAKATKLPLADLKKSFANVVKKQKAFDNDSLGNLSTTIDSLRTELTGLDRDVMRGVAKALVELAVAEPKARVLVKTFTSNDGDHALGLCHDAIMALVFLDAGLEPLAWIEDGDEAVLAKLRPRAVARRRDFEDGEWALELEMLGMGSGAPELVLAERLFTLLALPCETDEEGIRLAMDATGPGSQGYESLLACAAWLRKRHGLPAARILDPKPGWDGGAKEKIQGSYEMLAAALRVAPSLVPDMAVKLFAQAWAPKRVPGLWLAFAEHLEDHVKKGEGRFLSATARLGDVQLKFSRGKVKIEPAKTVKPKRAKK